MLKLQSLVNVLRIRAKRLPIVGSAVCLLPDAEMKM